ncbi:MAG TPA: hypothetical protein VK391_01675, partial [Allosphingosinicella sp.]|nr:hypothetical protein [Allosphingosinicella sp.]
MTKAARNSGGRSGIPWRIIGWGMAALLLLLPYVANAPWTASDYVFAAVLFGGVGLAFELIVRKSVGLSFRLGSAVAVIGGFLAVWVNGAVGMIGSEDNPYNLLFLCVPLLALLGAIVARFRAGGTAIAMAAAGIAQTVLAAIGISSDPRGGIFSMAFAGIW